METNVWFINWNSKQNCWLISPPNVFFIISLRKNELHIRRVDSPLLNYYGIHLFIQTVLSSLFYFVLYFMVQSFLMKGCSPGEKMSGLKRMSKEVLLMEPTALQAFRTTSRLLGSECGQDYKEQENKMLKETHRQITSTTSTIRSLRLLYHAGKNQHG